MEQMQELTQSIKTNNEKTQCKCGGSYTRRTLSAHKKTNKHINSSAIKGQAYQHNYYQTHKIEIEARRKERNKEITQCECGGRYSHGSLSAHKKTNKHIKHCAKTADLTS
jgi:hypothetical protein